MMKLPIKTGLAVTCLLTLSACAEMQRLMEPPIAIPRVKEEMRQANKSSAQLPAPVPQSAPEEVATSLLPPLEMPLPDAVASEVEPRFDLSVSEAPVNQVLLGIVSGTPYSMLVSPDVKGQISVQLKDTTVPEALDALRELYGYEYKVEGKRIHVSNAKIATRLYKVNYIVGLRKGRSDIAVTAGAASTSGSSGGSSKASSVESSQEADFWHELETSLKSVLQCSSSSSQAVGGDAQAAPAQNSCADNTVLVNPMSGTVFVRAMPQELRIVDELLGMMQESIARQVILEAKIIDVELNEGAQQGINWSEFRNGAHHGSVGISTTSLTESYGNGGRLNSGTTLGDLLGNGLTNATGSAFTSGLGVALQVRDFSALLNFLQTQGSVNVLSSPRISTINNQKAILKIGRDEQYVTGFESGSSSTTASTGSTVNNQPTPTYSTFFSGISLDVTPQIDETGNITLHVHPLVSEVTEVMKQTINNMFLPFASNKISETDSVVKVRDGQIVVIGGLMTETQFNQQNKVTGAGDIPLLGTLFRKLKRGTTKRELVIMLKPTVVKNNDAWANDIADTKRRIDELSVKQDTSAPSTTEE